MNPYATHQPSLAMAVVKTSGAILELGAGHYSTPLLHALAGGTRTLLTVDNSYGWLEEFRALATAWHTLLHARDWKSGILPLAESPWSVCLIDNEPYTLRGWSIDLLRKNTEVFVVHDSEPQHDNNDNFGYSILCNFRYRRNDRRMPRTTIVSEGL
jgi:hypothetical protein